MPSHPPRQLAFALVVGLALTHCSYDVAFLKVSGSGGSNQGGATSMTNGGSSAAAGGSSAGAGNSNTTVSAGSTSVSSYCPSSSQQPGESYASVQVGNATRTYLLHVPASYSGTSPVPLVLDFHGLADLPQNEADNSGYRDLSDQQGFIVAWPQGVDLAWNLGICCTSSRTVDDLGFARAIVQQIQQNACIDAKRIYATGYVLGGGMAMYLGCNAADLFAGVVSNSFDLWEEAQEPCQPSRPVTEVSFRGFADPIIPYAGGPDSPPNLPSITLNFLGAVGTFQKWAALDQCPGSPSAADANGCSTYSQCQGGAQVTLCTTQGGGEDWGSPAIAWDILKAHPLP